MSGKSTAAVSAAKSSLNVDRSGLLPRQCDCGNAAGLTGKCSGCQSKRLMKQPDSVAQTGSASVLHELIQPKLTVGEPGNKYEQEADQVAEQVMRMSEPSIQRQMEPEEDEEEGMVQRKIADQITPLVQRQVLPEMKEEEEEVIQTKSIDNQAAPSAPTQESPEVPHSVHEVLRSPGQPLDPVIRVFMEPRFGHDFSQVRVHSGGAVEQSALDVNAHAYTVGQHIVFGAGRYAPGTPGGRHLIAHELAHTIDQASSETTWLDRQPRNQGSAALDKPAFPYGATLAVDQVALRASPAGRRSDERFHNLVASLRQDVTLVVEGSTRGWLKVRLTSGTALNGRTNEPMNAAGLTGYVSRELLVRQVTPAAVPTPQPTADPAAYSSLDAFSDAWPDRVTSPDAIEQVWLSQSKQVWTNKALAAAGINPADWQPSARFRKSKSIFEKVYRYYASLYLADNRLKWAAMAKLAGGEVFRGFRDQIVLAEEFGEFVSSAGKRDDGALSIGDLIGGGYEIYAGSVDVVLLRMQKAIFMDLAWQHEAYREGGLKALAAAKARGEIGDDLLAAWQDIESGDSGRVNAGNAALLQREQLDVLQGGGFYAQIQNIPDNDIIPETMSEEALSPIPGGRPFAKVVSGGDITKFNDRWKWLKEDMIPAFEKLDRATLERLVNKSLDELADRKF
jgi:hypothetical protein